MLIVCKRVINNIVNNSLLTTDFILVESVLNRVFCKKSVFVVVVVVVCCSTLNVVPSSSSLLVVSLLVRLRCMLLFDILLSRFNKLLLLLFPLPLPCGERRPPPPTPTPTPPVIGSLLNEERRLRPILSLVMLEERRFIASSEVYKYNT